jgi:hypothetical protein
MDWNACAAALLVVVMMMEVALVLAVAENEEIFDVTVGNPLKYPCGMLRVIAPRGAAVLDAKTMTADTSGVLAPFELIVTDEKNKAL